MGEMGVFKPDEVNEAFAAICPGELTSKYAMYPIRAPYNERWLKVTEEFEGKPVFIKALKDEGIKTDYIWCKNGTRGKGYYHVLTKIAYNNLYSRLKSEGAGAGCCGLGDLKRADQHDTVCRIVYNRARCNRPDDVAGAEQAIDHLAGTQVNPLHGVNVTVTV